MSKVLLIDIGGTNLRYAYADGDLSSLKDTNKIKPDKQNLCFLF